MTTYILPYVDPDTDGVGSALGYADFRRRTSGDPFEAVIFGSCDEETTFLLHHFDLDPPRIVVALPPEAPLILVDTHHPNQLPSTLPLSMVVEILDHHPAGKPAAFPNATIENELIGAVATLVAEKLVAYGDAPKFSLAGILAAAIVSNTLNFAAPSTTQRDRDAFRWLTRFTRVDNALIAEMFVARSQWVAMYATEQVLIRDYKQFEFDGVSVGIAQIEMCDSDKLTNRLDLLAALEALKGARRLTHVLLNVVDLGRSKSTLITPNVETQRLLYAVGGIEFREGVAHCDRIYLRKTELVPWLQRGSSK